MKKIILYLLSSFLLTGLFAQKAQTLKIKVIDDISKEPLQGAVVLDENKHQTVTDAQGNFNILSSVKHISISFTGYQTKNCSLVDIKAGAITLTAQNNLLQQVVVSSNRTAEKRSEAPIAINTIGKQTIEDAKANRMDHLLNKVSGVFMVNLGNEQHQMSIRQPMTTKSLFLYMEDGLPIRTTGVYNHNALLEINMPAAKSIEVIKGPSSALYGAEAIGGAVNVMTQAAPAYANGYASFQLNNNGYKRADVQAGTGIGKWGVLASGYYANRANGPVDYSDFHKLAMTLRTDFKPTEKTTWTNTFSYVDYYSDMTGALDSSKFSQKNYSTPHTFTYRSVTAFRAKSMLSQQWNANSHTAFSVLYRNNEVRQNPSYSVASTSNPLIYKGQVNSNAFSTAAVYFQHVQKFHWLKSKLVAGASAEISPQSYYAKFIWIQKDASNGKYTGYTMPSPDSMLSRYNTNISNLAGFANFDFSPIKQVKVVAAIRYDAFKYNFQNQLPVSATSGGPSSITDYSRVTPKIGFTYNRNGLGFYGNYSEGYVPPQITELFNSVKTPYLQPQTFYNYEIGGWMTLAHQKMYIDWSIYRLNGTNEVISVKQSDGSSQNQNSGKTKHEGIEYGMHYVPNTEWLFRLSGTNSRHVFVENIVKGINYNGKEMSTAPRFTANAEIMYKPKFAKGLRVGIEWQHQSKYFMDDLNFFQYKGFDLVNFRLGYQIQKLEFWMNALNAFNQYYAVMATKSSTASGNASYAYTLGDPHEFSVGMAVHFGKK